MEAGGLFGSGEMRGDTGAAPAASATEPCPSCGKYTCVAMKLGPQRDMSWGRGSSSVTTQLSSAGKPAPRRPGHLSSPLPAPAPTAACSEPALERGPGWWPWGQCPQQGTMASPAPSWECLRNGSPSAPQRFPKSGLHSGDQSSCSVKGLLCPLQGRRALGWEAGTRTPDPPPLSPPLE